jgi:hypothetical protein
MMAKSIVPSNRVAICRKCGEVFVSRIELGKHYKDNPDHIMPKGQITPKAQKKLEEVMDKIQNEQAKEEQGQDDGEPKKDKYKRRKKTQEQPSIASLVRFCPCCGLDLMRLEKAIQLMREME